MRRAFRIVAGVLGVATIGLTVPFAVGAFFGDADRIHRLHFTAGALGSGILLGVSLVVCALDPDDLAPFWVAVAAGVATSIAGIVSGDFISGIYFTAPIVLLVLFVLHPRRRSLFAIEGVDAPTAAVGFLAVVPAVAFALTQAELQRNGVASDPHVEFHHYSAMASYALAPAGRLGRRVAPARSQGRGVDRRRDGRRPRPGLPGALGLPGRLRPAVVVAHPRVGARDHRGSTAGRTP
jgi:hypothetical protein